ncbi:metallophosphoesterase family protein [Saccharibacillus sacchari]|uniref:metallophosphoesterase family protein n=1 Tax=Saccharibacillus sacchari TaxID=456493 RepID=UPI0004B9F13D|nr:metallophosphoesterase [Saccharibacillus sacchari]
MTTEIGLSRYAFLTEALTIVVVSDTHMPRMAKALPPALVAELPNADLILHAGDWTRTEVYDLLAAYAPVEGVAGNNDGPEISDRWGYHRIVEIGDRRIGLTHGHLGRGSTADKARAVFENEQADLIVFGHSHIPFFSREEGTGSGSSVALFNPGSPTDKRRQAQFSFGILTLQDGRIDCEHRYYDSEI